MKKTKNHPCGVLLPERLENEPVKWFSRFINYVLQPPGKRSVERIFQDEQKATKKGAKGNVGQQRPGGAWRRAYIDHEWERRGAEYDVEVAFAESVELASLRKQGRARRAALVSQFLEATSGLLSSPSVLAAAPAGVSAAVLRAIEAARSEFGAAPFPEIQERDGRKYPGSLPPAEVRLFLDDGSGNPLPFDQWPTADKLEPQFDPLTGETALPSETMDNSEEVNPSV